MTALSGIAAGSLDQKKWVWGRHLPALSCKARLFSRLERSGPWPVTWVFRDVNEVESWSEIDGDEEYFVKTPSGSGGKGTYRGRDASEAKALAKRVLAESAAVVIQMRIEPALLPLGPSVFELRVWAIFRNDTFWTFSVHRAKTAKVGNDLMNKRVQEALRGEYGAYYERNVVDESTLRQNIRGYDERVKPIIRDAVGRVHDATRADIPPHPLFFFVGFDFILDKSTHVPLLIEANVKPPERFESLEHVKFPSPIVLNLARHAIRDLARLMLEQSDRSTSTLCQKKEGPEQEEEQFRWIPSSIP